MRLTAPAPPDLVQPAVAWALGARRVPGPVTALGQRTVHPLAPRTDSARSGAKDGAPGDVHGEASRRCQGDALWQDPPGWCNAQALALVAPAVIDALAPAAGSLPGTRSEHAQRMAWQRTWASVQRRSAAAQHAAVQASQEGGTHAGPADNQVLRSRPLPGWGEADGWDSAMHLYLPGPGPGSDAELLAYAHEGTCVLVLRLGPGLQPAVHAPAWAPGHVLSVLRAPPHIQRLQESRPTADTPCAPWAKI